MADNIHQQFTKANNEAWMRHRDSLERYIRYRRLSDHSQDTVPFEHEIAEYAFSAGFMKGTLYALSLMPEPLDTGKGLT